MIPVRGGGKGEKKRRKEEVSVLVVVTENLQLHQTERGEELTHLHINRELQLPER